MCEDEYDDDSKDDNEMFEQFVNKETKYDGVEKEADNVVWKGKEKVVVEGDDIDYEELKSDCGSDKYESRPNFPVFNLKVDVVNLVFQLGMIFIDHYISNKSIKSYFIKNGKNIIIVRSEALGVKAVCISSNEFT